MSASVFPCLNSLTGLFNGSKGFFFLSTALPTFSTLFYKALKFYKCSRSWWSPILAILFLPSALRNFTNVSGGKWSTPDVTCWQRFIVSLCSAYYASLRILVFGTEVRGLGCLTGACRVLKVGLAFTSAE